MQKIKSIAFALVIGIAAVGSTTVPASATVILNVAGGQLTGAQNVLVGGTLYDVTFADGTCIAFFNGCDNQSDFAFNSISSASAAAQALLDQVFIDSALGSFDTRPDLTAGCTDTTICQTLLPYGFSSFSATTIWTALTQNLAPGGTDVVSFSPKTSNFDTATGAFNARVNFAIFTPAASAAIPEPGTLLLFAVGLAGLAAFGRHRRRG